MRASEIPPERRAEVAHLQWLLSLDEIVAARPIPGGRCAWVQRFMFTHAICVGKIGDTYAYDDRWCYQTREDAERAMMEWDGTGEPTRWHRHPMSGRRRPDGDPSREYVNP